MRMEYFRRSTLAGVVAVAAACNGSTPVAPPPPVVTNTPPVIGPVTIAADRVEADRPIQVTAAVSDAETSLDRLTYTWSATPGGGVFAFTGVGPTAMWTPPPGQTTPGVHTITLTVAETFTSAGQPQVNSVSRSTTVNYHDSPAETIAMAIQFIRDFGTFAVSPDECVRNFSDTCPGKAEERDQIAQNRVDFTIESAGFSVRPTAQFDGGLTSGVVEGPCIFIDVPNSGPNAGKRQSVSGTCRLNTVYQNSRWFLCDSFFLDTGETVLLSLRSRLPGRLVFE
jgi:hypothetical protein